MSEPLLEVSDLAVRYGDVQALWGISFQIREGELVTLVGSNGAGKTTTLRTISGLVAPSAGAIRFRGDPIAGLPPDRIVELGISHIPEGRLLFPDMTVWENLVMGAYPKAQRAHVTEGLDWVYRLFPRLRERERQAVRTMSGGEQQMVAIGRALMARPAVLLVDEPSLGLAPLLVADLFSVLREINRAGVTILLVEQNVRHALEISHRAYVLETGRIVLEGPAHDLIRHDHVRSAYLGL
jgi:branched-chain amino acid transport system ATP-binding protein